jgi:cellulase/cellobiase CelA1
VASVKVTAGNVAINGWKVTLTLPSGATVANAWNATFSGAAPKLAAANMSYNGRIAATQSTEFGFQGTGGGTGVTATCTAS